MSGSEFLHGGSNASRGGSRYSASTGFASIAPGANGVRDRKLLQGKTFTCAGEFPGVSGDIATIASVVKSFGGKAISKLSSNTGKMISLPIFVLS